MQDLTVEKDGEIWNYVFGQAPLAAGREVTLLRAASLYMERP